MLNGCVTLYREPVEHTALGCDSVFLSMHCIVKGAKYVSLTAKRMAQNGLCYK